MTFRRRAEAPFGSPPLERLDSHAIVPIERRHAARVDEDQHLNRNKVVSAGNNACSRLCEARSIQRSSMEFDQTS